MTVEIDSDAVAPLVVEPVVVVVEVEVVVVVVVPGPRAATSVAK